MPNEYITRDEALEELVVKIVPEKLPALDKKIETASRAVDDYLGVAEGYFSPVTMPTTKILRGRGSSFIHLPAQLSGDVTIIAPPGVYVPNFGVEDGRLITLDPNDNPSPYYVWANVYYSVTGLWGYPETPSQVREATLKLTAHFWNMRDRKAAGFVADMQIDEAYPERDYPRAVRRLLDEFSRKLSGKPKGGLVIA